MNPAARTIPDKYEPLVGQLLVNLAITGQLSDRWTARALLAAPLVNEEYDAWLEQQA